MQCITVCRHNLHQVMTAGPGRKGRGKRKGLLQIVPEEGVELVGGEFIHLVIQIDMAGVGDNVQFFRFGSQFISVFTENLEWA